MSLRAQTTLSFACSLFVFAPAALVAQSMIHHDFERDESGWTAYGADSAHVRITHDAAQVKNGKGALELDFEASATKPAAAVLPVRQSLQPMQSIRLWMMAESPTAAAITLSEKEGGRYVAAFWLEPHVWQRVEVMPEDFALGQSPNDPKDPDGKLDLDQVEGIGVIDISQVLNATTDEHAARLAVVTHTGPRKLFIDDFEVSAERPAWYHARPAYQIDNFDHPQLDWFTLGGPEMKLDDSRKVIAGNALTASYQQMEDAFVLMLHPLPQSTFAGATHLRFDIASDIDAHLMLLLEPQAPATTRYHAGIEVKGGGKAEHREVALAAFQSDNSASASPAAELDPTKLRVLGLLDISGAYTGETAANTIRIGNIAMTKNAPTAK